MKLKIIFPASTLSEVPQTKAYAVQDEPPNERAGLVFTFVSSGSIVSGGHALRALRYSRQRGSDRFLREWRAAHGAQLEFLPPIRRREVIAALREECEEAAEQMLWEQILLAQGLGISQGLGNLVYCGSGEDLDQLRELDDSLSKRLRNLGPDHHYALLWSREHLYDRQG